MFCFVSWKFFYVTCTILFTHSLQNADFMNVKIINVLLFEKEKFLFESMFEMARECTLTEKNLACSMITVSENATPLTLLRYWILSAIVRNKSTRIYIPKTIVICNTSMISVKVKVLLKEMFSSWY